MVTLPPLAALRAFEATVRLGGLARAAVELNLITNAISHQSHTGARQLSAAGGVLSLLEDVGIGTGTVRPSRSRCWRSSVSHARSASLLAPRRPTARCPRTRTLRRSLATPPESGSMRAASSPHCPSAFHPTGDIFRDAVR